MKSLKWYVFAVVYVLIPVVIRCTLLQFMGSWSEFFGKILVVCLMFYSILYWTLGVWVMYRIVYKYPKRVK